MKLQNAIRGNFFFYAFAIGAAFPYLAPFFKEHLQATDQQIGLLLMIRPAMALLLVPFWTMAADTRGKRAFLTAVLSISAGIVFPFVLIPSSFIWIVLLLALWAGLHAPLWSMGDSIAFDYLGHHRRTRLANFRVFGSLGWIVAVLICGKWFDLFSLKWLFPIYATGIIVSGLLIIKAPSNERMPLNIGKQALIKLLKKKNVLILMGILLIAETANQMAYAFLSLYGKHLGASNLYVGIIWATATLAEVFTMTFFSRIVARIGIKRILAAGIAFAVIRWIPLAFLSSWWQLLPFQTLHAFTFVFVYIGTATFMDVEASKKIRSTAQAFYTTIILNLSAMIGSFLGGQISQKWGYGFLFTVSGVMVFIAAIILILFVKEPPTGESD